MALDLVVRSMGALDSVRGIPLLDIDVSTTWFRGCWHPSVGGPFTLDGMLTAGLQGVDNRGIWELCVDTWCRISTLNSRSQTI